MANIGTAYVEFALAAIVDSVDVPDMVKKTSAGVWFRVVRKHKSVGVTGVDISGVGGIIWAVAEYCRVVCENGDLKAQM